MRGSPGRSATRSRRGSTATRRARGASFCHERRSPSARSRGGNHVSPTAPPSSCPCGGTSRFPHTPSTRSSANRGWPMSRFARTADLVAARQDARAAGLSEDVRAFVQPAGDERALDVGTGAGALALALAPVVREVVGLDPVPELVELARERAAPNAEFVEGDGTALPFPDGDFDL